MAARFRVAAGCTRYNSDVVELLRAPLFSTHGFVHAFTLRGGGVSEGPYAALNLGRAVGDDPDSVAENHRLLAAAVGYAEGRLYEISQVHGRAVRTVASADDPTLLRTEQADALIAFDAGTVVGVRTADCVPVVLADPDRGAVAVVHAGWRGAVAGVVEAAVERLCGGGSAHPGRLLAAIFPHIRLCCFEVGDEVADAVAPIDAHCIEPARAAAGRTRPHVALARVVTTQLRACGLRPELIADVPGCTRCEPERFFSYRRQGPKSGRHVTLAVARG